MESCPLVSQLIKNPPGMQESWALYLGWEDPLQKGMATHSSILENSVNCIVHEISKSQAGLIDTFYIDGKKIPGPCEWLTSFDEM